MSCRWFLFGKPLGVGRRLRLSLWADSYVIECRTTDGTTYERHLTIEDGSTNRFHLERDASPEYETWEPEPDPEDP